MILLGGLGSGRKTGCGKCGDCNHLERRGIRGHQRYYCDIINKRTDRYECPLDTLEAVPIKNRILILNQLRKRGFEGFLGEKGRLISKLKPTLMFRIILRLLDFRIVP